MMDSSSLRIAFLSDAIEERNGVGTYYKDLAEHLSDRCARVELICPNMTSPGPHQGFSVWMPGDRTQRLYLPKPRALGRILRDLEPHIVVAATPGPYGMLGIRHARRLGAKVCIGHHTDLEGLAELYWNRFVGRLSMGGMKWLNRRFFRSGSVVVTFNEEMAESAGRIGARDVRMVGTPLGKRFLEEPRAPLPHELRSVLFAGRLAPEKNLEAVIEAAEELPHLRFMIVGDGPLRRLVENAAARLKNVEYMGWVERREIIGHIDRADLLVLPSHIESFGTIALEAMSRGRLVLVSPHCGIVEYEDLARGIFQMRPGQSVAEAIRDLEAMPAEVREARVEAATASARALTQQALSEWLEIFEELAGGAQPAGPHLNGLPSGNGRHA